MISSLDAHECVKSLTAAGFSDTQAEALTDVLKLAIDIDLSNIATKDDLADLRTEIADLWHELSTEITDLRRELAQLELRLTKWVIGIGIAATLAIGGVLWAAVQFLLHALPHA